MTRSIFFISKPLQYINATNIKDDYPKVCVFINTMNDGERIFKLLDASSAHWDEMFFFNTKQEAFTWLIEQKSKIRNLYLDTDFGLVIQRQLNKVKADIYIYEEGIGTYLTTIRKPSLASKIIVGINRMLGNQDYLGGYKKTKGVYVYNHELHKEHIPGLDKPRLKFERSFVEQIENFADKDVFFPPVIKAGLEKLKGKKVILYLTSWKVSEKAIAFLNNYADYVQLVKPHPNIKNDIAEFKDKEVLSGFVPAEMLIIFLLGICSEVIVVHQGSSVGMYLNGYDNLKIVNINEEV